MKNIKSLQDRLSGKNFSQEKIEEIKAELNQTEKKIKKSGFEEAEKQDAKLAIKITVSLVGSEIDETLITTDLQKDITSTIEKKLEYKKYVEKINKFNEKNPEVTDKNAAIFKEFIEILLSKIGFQAKNETKESININNENVEMFLEAINDALLEGNFSEPSKEEDFSDVDADYIYFKKETIYAEQSESDWLFNRVKVDRVRKYFEYAGKEYKYDSKNPLHPTMWRYSKYKKNHRV